MGMKNKLQHLYGLYFKTKTESLFLVSLVEV